jgi:hypothetical protein
MNPNEIQFESQTPSLVPTKECREEHSPDTRMEPCEFENLLRRAMEIVSARAQSAPPSST